MNALPQEFSVLPVNTVLNCKGQDKVKVRQRVTPWTLAV